MKTENGIILSENCKNVSEEKAEMQAHCLDQVLATFETLSTNISHH
uniref:Uncharacterized protein n=1 Tax=Lepeophtheirus salmonis TaxID=72036 RepID=A0A0K2UBG7_LEPSM